MIVGSRIGCELVQGEAGAPFAMIYLGCNDDLVSATTLLECTADDFLAFAVSIDITCVDQIDTGVECCGQNFASFFFRGWIGEVVSSQT